MTIIQHTPNPASTHHLKFIDKLEHSYDLHLKGTDHDQLVYWQGFDPSYGIPNCLREKLLRVGMGEVALVLDAAVLCGIETGDQFTFDALAQRLNSAGINVANGLVRRALSSGVFVAISVRKPRKGRPQLRYTLPSLKYLSEKYEAGYWLSTDPLQVEDLKNLKAYRIALHREFIRRCPGNYSRAFLGRRLGVGESTTRNYDRIAAIQVIYRYERDWLNAYVNGLDLIPETRKGYSTWLEIEPAEKNRKTSRFRAPPSRRIAAIWISRGASVILVKQLTNSYQI